VSFTLFILLHGSLEPQSQVKRLSLRFFYAATSSKKRRKHAEWRDEKQGVGAAKIELSNEKNKKNCTRDFPQTFPLRTAIGKRKYF
jgi:hypothetical protein